jgi:hypothetical protein
MNPTAVRHLQELRRQLFDPPATDNDDPATSQTVTAAA